MTTTQTGTKGKIVQVLGAVVDIEFPPDHLPEIYNEVQTRPVGSEFVLFWRSNSNLGITGYVA